MAAGTPLPLEDREKLIQLRERRGETRAAKILGISKHTLARAAAGFGVFRGTRLLILTRLAQVDPDREAA